MAGIGPGDGVLGKIQEARTCIEALKEQIEAIRVQKRDQSLSGACRSHDVFSECKINPLKTRRVLRGHFGKVYSSCWSGDSVHLVSASQDGKLIVWNGVSSNKVQSIPLTSSWVIACAYEQSVNRLVASGGMDNICTVHRVGQAGGANRLAQVS
jgi:guanine nucleotide-binding protein G(I)/G(S)/G(T) subunit beta-1